MDCLLPAFTVSISVLYMYVYVFCLVTNTPQHSFPILDTVIGGMHPVDRLTMKITARHSAQASHSSQRKLCGRIDGKQCKAMMRYRVVACH